MANPNPVVIGTALRPWDPNILNAYLGASYVDSTFSGGGGNKTPLRLMANADVRLYGEVILEKGLFRSYEGFGFTSYSSVEPLVSFRQGSAMGDEVLRIQTDGTIQSAAAAPLKFLGDLSPAGTTAFQFTTVADVPAGKSALAIFEGLEPVLTLSGRSDEADNLATLQGFGTSGFKILANDGTVASGLTLSGSHVGIHADNSGTESFWGRAEFVAGVRSLTFQGATAYTRDLQLRTKTLGLYCSANSTSFGLWGTFSNESSTVSRLELPEDFEVMTGGSRVVFRDSGAAARFDFDVNANLTMTAPADQSPDIYLDSTATTGGKEWRIRSDATSSIGMLRFTNITDSLTVDFDTDGSVYSPGYLGCQVLTDTPDSGAARPGAMVITSISGVYRIYCKVGESTWRSVLLG